VKVRHLLTLQDWTPDEIRQVLSLARQMKEDAREGRLRPTLVGKTLALIFEKSSMRTRVSFEVAMTQLGGHSVYLSQGDINLGKREPVKDGARVLSRYVDGIAARVYSHRTLEELAAYSNVPVINALSDRAHPCQALADIMTVQKRYADLQKVTLAYIGDANNVARSLAVVCAKLGVKYRIACPPAHQFDRRFLREVESIPGASIEVTDAPAKAAAGADVLYTDTWISMGQEAEAERRLRDFECYRINAALLKRAAKDAMVMHCLPAVRGNEITDEVIEGPQSAVFDQAENRLHTQRALLQMLMGDERALL